MPFLCGHALPQELAIALLVERQSSFLQHRVVVPSARLGLLVVMRIRLLLVGAPGLLPLQRAAAVALRPGLP